MDISYKAPNPSWSSSFPSSLSLLPFLRYVFYIASMLQVQVATGFYLMERIQKYIDLLNGNDPGGRRPPALCRSKK